jgi:hypothetical protein
MYATWTFGVAGMAVYGLMTDLWHALVASFLTHMLFELGQVIWTTMLQQQVPRNLLGRVASLDWMVSIGLVPVSYALTGPVAEAIGPGTTMVVAACCSSTRACVTPSAGCRSALCQKEPPRPTDSPWCLASSGHASSAALAFTLLLVGAAHHAADPALANVVGTDLVAVGKGVGIGDLLWVDHVLRFVGHVFVLASLSVLVHARHCRAPGLAAAPARTPLSRS